LRELETLRTSPDQILRSYAYDLVTATGAREALDAVSEAHEGADDTG